MKRIVIKSIIIPNEYTENSKKYIINVKFNINNSYYRNNDSNYQIITKYIDETMDNIMKFIYIHIVLLKPHVNINKKLIEQEMFNILNEIKFVYYRDFIDQNIHIDKWYFGKKINKNLDIII